MAEQGAGVHQGQPFLVAEYMPRGALDEVLQDAALDLPWSRRAGFAADAACGMAYLHSRAPPRLHRDLKVGGVWQGHRDVGWRGMKLDGLICICMYEKVFPWAVAGPSWLTFFRR